ncbi:MAG: hypothetical protein K6E40_15285, partial [Desulfovibrio sp.]|nr:hypothetical protein [Desulfovibrio sp.]
MLDPDAKNLTDAERRAFRERIDADVKAAAKEKADRQARVAKTAASIWNEALPAPNSHPYLFRKQVPSFGLRLARDGRLIEPVMNVTGDLQSLQFIDSEGNKRFLAGGKVSGGFMPIPAKDGRRDGTIAVVEGYATGATIHQSTGFAVLVA